MTEDEELKEILANITPREAKVLRERFGIELSNDLSLEEMKKLFDATRQRIQEIEEKALISSEKRKNLKTTMTQMMRRNVRLWPKADIIKII